MSDNLTVFGTDYTGVTGIKAKGTGNGTLTYIRPTGTKSISENGTGIDVAAYSLVDVSVAGGGGDSYTLTTVVPQQTFTPVTNQNNAYQAELTYSSGLVSGEPYIITYDGEEYVCDCSDPLWGTDQMMGTIAAMWGDRGDGVFPFAVDYSGGAMYVASFDLNQHTIKIEHLEFVDGPLNLIAKSITSNGTYTASSDNADGYSSVTVNVPSGGGTYQAKTNISPTTSSQTITPDSGYDALSSVQINAMPTGTAGTPSATKGTVSNHSVSVTPSVTNGAGYIEGGTKTGTAVTVSASELVSGTVTISGSGTTDVTNYASASVAAGGATASATKGSVSNHSVSVTPSVTRTAGYVTAGSSNGTAVTVSASELVSGSETKTENGTYDVTNLASVTVAIPIVTYHTSSSAPTSSQGSDGDLWLVTA